MDVVLWRRSGSKSVIPLPAEEANRAYAAHKAILGHAWCGYYRVTLNDPLAGDRILRDTYDDERKVA